MAENRTMEVVTDVIHPITGEVLITEEIIKKALNHRSIEYYDYVLHDKDVYTEQQARDYSEAHPDTPVTAGTPKPPHYHVGMRFTRPNSTATIAKWFGVPENFIKIWKGGERAFLDMVQYHTHEHPNQQAQGKHRYPDEEIHANFDFRKALDERYDEKLKYGRNLSDRDKMRYDVLYLGKTLRECEAKDRYLYMSDIEKLKKFRMEYISNQKPPTTRINYYIVGRGGVGKGMMSRAIARNLFPHLKNDEDIFFEVGAKGAAFEGYDGQPVIIWNDRRAIDLLQELNGRGNVFNVFDTHPTKQKQNIKYGSVNLCNVVNIVNSVQDYTEFLEGLAGGYTDRNGEEHEAEDRGQSFRRFPFMIVLHEADYDMMLNRGFIENTANFEEYIEYNHIRGNMQRIAERCGANEALARQLEGQVVKPIADKHLEVIEQFESMPTDEKAILAEFSDYGKMLEKKEPVTTESDDEFEEELFE